MRSLQFRHLFAACVAVCAIPLSAGAQQAAQQPPGLEPLSEGEAVAAEGEAREREQVTATEKRVRGGIVTEITVNSSGSTYYLKPNSPIGTTLPGDAESNRLRGAQWGILQFDLGGGRQQKAPAVQAPQPPAPPATK